MTKDGFFRAMVGLGAFLAVSAIAATIALMMEPGDYPWALKVVGFSWILLFLAISAWAQWFRSGSSDSFDSLKRSTDVHIGYSASVYRVLVASPSDVREARELVVSQIYSWNSLNSKDLNVVLLPVLWETDVVPELGRRPQESVNAQIVDGCTILIGLFWTRLGTPTGVAASGTVEEIERFENAGKRVLLYFSEQSLPPDVDTEQLEKLRAFKANCMTRGIVDRFSDLQTLGEKIRRHLTVWAKQPMLDGQE